MKRFQRLRYVLMAATAGLGMAGVFGWLLMQGLAGVAQAQVAERSDQVLISSCSVTFDDGATIYSNLQEAVDDSAPGDLVKIAGTCNGVEVRNGMTQTVLITKPLTFRGGYTTTDWLVSDPQANPTTLDAQVQGRVVVISGTNSTIENLTITGGAATGRGLCINHCGGGIYASHSLTVSQVIFSDNRSAWDGGGVAVEGPLYISSTVFVSNTSVLAGGAVHAEGTVTILDSLFEQNTSVANVGGAIFTEGETVIINSTFISNTTLSSGLIGHGGALYGFAVNITIIDSLFLSNRCLAADCDGGGLYFGSAFNPVQLTLWNTDFINNSAIRNGGGAFANSLVQINSGRFEGNQAGGESSILSSIGGGGIYAREVTVTGTHFISNTSGRDGGGLLSRLQADLTGATFRGNNAARHGGGAAGSVFLTETRVTTSHFISNSAGFNGGGLWAGPNGAAVSNSHFTGNHADGPENDGGLLTFENGGGGIWTEGELILSDTTLISNMATTNGGGAHVEGDAQVKGGLIAGNEAHGDFSVFSYGGGGLYVRGNSNLSGTVIIHNQAYQGGGLWSLGSVQGMEVTLQENTVDSAGGGLFGFGDLRLSGSVISGNVIMSTTSSSRGGGAFVDGAAYLTDTTFANNHAYGVQTFGGGLSASGLTDSGGTYLGNSSTDAGGAANIFGLVNISGTLFSQNTSGGDGGALNAFVVFPGILEIENSQFLDNAATGTGGAVYLFGWGNIQGSQFTDNSSATEGGGLYASGKIVITDTHFADNSAAGNGGAIFSNSDAVLLGVLFENNSSDSRGGGLYENSRLWIVQDDAWGETSFYNNNASDGGGAYVRWQALLTGGRFEGNQALNLGGGLVVGQRIEADGTFFIANSADMGGGLAVRKDLGGSNPSRLVNVLLSQNEANSHGAGLYFANDIRPLEILHSTFANLALIDGEAIYAISGTVSITNSIFNNFATGLAQTGVATVTQNYSLFYSNTIDLVGTVGGGSGTVNGDPSFNDPAAGDYRLLANSAAIDQGASVGVNSDFEGDVRPLGLAPDIGFDEWSLPDLSIVKKASPQSAAPGSPITYVVTFSNAGLATASSIVLTDTLPVEVTGTVVINSGAAITATSNTPLVWQVTDLDPGQGGTITITGVLTGGLPAGTQIINTASIAGDPAVNDDPVDNSSSAGITILNAPPIGQDDTYITLEDRTLTVTATGVLGNDEDLNGDALSALLLSEPSHGTLQLSLDGSFVYTPVLNYSGDDSFTYEASDGLATSGSVMVTIAVDAVNDPPTVFPFEDQITWSATPVGPISVVISDTDTPLDDLVLSAISSVQTVVADGNIVIGGSGANRTLILTPALTLVEVTATITVTVSDGEFSQSASFLITVKPFNLLLPYLLLDVSN